jgi:hypothetical protein
VAKTYCPNVLLISIYR